jgi:hypothetical protein
MKTTQLILFLAMACGGGGDDTGQTGATTFESNPLAKCDPDATQLTPNPIEGDTVEIEIRCASGNALTDYDVALVDGPEGASLNGSIVTFTPGLADAGKTEVFLSFDHPETIGETLIIKVDISDAWGVAGNELPDPATYDEEFGIEVLWIDLTTGSDITDTAQAATAIWHGNPYDIEVSTLGVDDAGNTKRDLWFGSTDALGIDFNSGGVDTRTSMALLASANDPTRMRQRLGFETWEALREPSGGALYAKCFFTTVYLNGEYNGLYTACELPDGELVGENDLPETTTAWMGVDEDANFRRMDAAGMDKLTLHDGLTPILGSDTYSIDTFVAFVADNTPADFWADAANVVPTAHLMDWAVFARVAHLQDNITTGVIYGYNPDTDTQMISPWGYAHSFGLAADGTEVASDAPLDFSRNLLLEHTLDGGAVSVDATFVGQTAPGQIFDPLTLAMRVDEWDEEFSAAATRDLEMWGEDPASYGTATTALKAWFADRDAWLRTP